MLNKELDLHVTYSFEEKELEVTDLLASEDALENVIFKGVESIDTMMQAFRATVETINEH